MPTPPPPFLSIPAAPSLPHRFSSSDVTKAVGARDILPWTGMESVAASEASERVEFNYAPLDAGLVIWDARGLSGQSLD